MNYTELEIDGVVYKLRLTTRSIVALEKSLGKNPIDILLAVNEGTMPKLTDLVLIFHSALQQFQHGISVDKAYDLFDAYFATGKTMFDFVNDVLVGVFTDCGFLAPNGSQGADEDNEKN